MRAKKIIAQVLLMTLITAQPLSMAHAEDASMVNMPSSISHLYSDMDMRVRLATKANAPECVEDSCVENTIFNARVQQLGAQLNDTAFAQYPALQARVQLFEFSVADKKQAGTASNAAGKIVMFRGLQAAELSDDAISFILAREMGHVIARHHRKNASTKLIISALATVLFPALGIIGTSSAAAQATTATTLLTSAASTATSILGGELAMANMKPNQLADSDAIAVKLLDAQGWDMALVADHLKLALATAESNVNSWLVDLQISEARLQALLNATKPPQNPVDEVMGDIALAQNTH